MKTLVLAPDYFSNESLSNFRELGVVQVKKLSRQELMECVHEFDVLAIRVDTIIDKELLDKASNLKLIVSATTGLDHVNVDLLNKKGIGLISLKGSNTTPTAEHVFALLFALYRKIPQAHNHVLAGGWDRHKFIGSNVAGKTLGVVGFGRIGQHVVTIAQALGMDVIAYDPYVNQDVFRNLDVQKLDLGLVLKSSDVVTCHMLLTDETLGMFNYDKFSLMKKSSVFINCSRGAVVNSDDLIQALQIGKISAAALDTFESEPLKDSDSYLKYAKNNSNLILTPHIGASTKESIRDSSLYVSQQAVIYFKKKENKF